MRGSHKTGRLWPAVAQVFRCQKIKRPGKGKRRRPDLAHDTWPKSTAVYQKQNQRDVFELTKKRALPEGGIMLDVADTVLALIALSLNR